MTIAEVGKRYGLTADTLRYYERMGLLPAVGRTPGGIRDYGEQDCNWVEFIKCMRDAGVSVENLKRYVALFRQGNKTVPERKLLLEEQRQNIEEQLAILQAVKERLDYKIERYEACILYENEYLHKK